MAKLSTVLVMLSALVLMAVYIGCDYQSSKTKRIKVLQLGVNTHLTLYEVDGVLYLTNDRGGIIKHEPRAESNHDVSK